MEYFVSYELAKKLKEKGFNEPCYMYYDEEGNLKQNIEYDPMNSGIGIDHLLVRNSCKWAIMECIAPTISQVLKWLREEKKIHIEPCILSDGDTDADGKIITHYTYWSFSVTSIETGDMIYFEYENIDDKRFDSYEQAALAGIEYALDNLP